MVGMFIKKIFDKTKTSDYLCPQTIGHISGTFTDFLVAFGIASIKISAVPAAIAAWHSDAEGRVQGPYPV